MADHSRADSSDGALPTTVNGRVRSDWAGPHSHRSLHRSVSNSHISLVGRAAVAAPDPSIREWWGQGMVNIALHLGSLAWQGQLRRGGRHVRPQQIHPSQSALIVATFGGKFFELLSYGAGPALGELPPSLY